MPASDPSHAYLETLSEISRAVSSTLDLRALYDTIFRQIGRVMDTSQFFIALHQPGSDVITVPYVHEDGRILFDEEFPYGDNTTSVVIETGQSLLYHSMEEYQDFERSHGLTPYVVGEDEGESGIFVPLNTGSRTIGALSVQTWRPHAYSPDDVQTLAVIASQAAIAIENARLYARSQDSVRQMEAVLQVAKALNEARTLPAVLDAMLRAMRDVLPYAYAAVLLPDSATGMLDVVGSISLGGEAVDRPETPLKIPFGHGISGAVFSSGEPLIVPDVRQFPAFVDHQLTGVFSEMAVPLRRGNTVVGVLDVGRAGVGQFSLEEVDLLSLFASQAAIAIENARLFSEQEERAEELQAVESIVRALMPLHDPVDIARTVDRELRRLIDYQTCCLYLIDEDTDVLVPIAHDVESEKVASMPVGEEFVGRIARRGEAEIVSDPGDGVDESVVGAPLVYRDQVHGVITISRVGRNAFDENARRLLEIIAAQVAIACDRTRLYHELHAAATTDPLVGLWNRRYLLERYREERLRAIRTRRPLVALMLDIDSFKRVNDTFGHDAGDAVLCELAGIIRSTTRAEDIVARYGGEEFCVLLPETPLPLAIQIAERLRATVESHRMPAEAGVGHVTVSVGIAVWTPDDSAEELFTRADVAMYRVKAAGGNGVSV